MNKMNYLFNDCVSRSNTQRTQRNLEDFFTNEEAKFYAETNKYTGILNKDYSLYVRCMSYKEYKYLIKGKILTNNKDYSEYYESNSKGFCFFKYTNDEDALFNYDVCLSRFSSDEVMLVVALPNIMMKKSSGFYTGGWKTEYCTTQLCITPDMVHHALFNIRDLVYADTKLQERINAFYARRKED